MGNDVPNQATRSTNQNFTIDIDKMFADWIGPIDEIRSYASVSTPATLKVMLAAAGTNADVTSLTKVLKIEKTLQESRCHAFFRWIGFPVVNSGKDNFYNPGFDIIRDLDRKLPLSEKISIANSPLSGFNKLSSERETFIQNNLATFSNSQDINSNVLAVSSGGTAELRKFFAPFEKNEKWDDTNTDHQSYVVNFNGQVGDNSVPLTAYQDSGGNTAKSVSSKRKHIITPFVVDARIDFSVAPKSKLIAVPFIPNNSFAKVSTTEYVKYPTLLERIIRERLTVGDPTATNGTAISDITSFVNTVPSIKDNELIQLVKQTVNGKNDQDKFIDTVNTITALMKLLDKSIKYITKVQGTYYWLPKPSTSGPEGGSEVWGVFLPSVISTNLQTPADTDIIVGIARNAINNTNPNVAKVTGQPDKGNFGQRLDQIDFSTHTSSAQGDNNKKNTDTLSQTRQHEMERANDALRTVEIITGEFSGLGLCDIVVIIGALNLITPQDLLGFLDKDAYPRMITALTREGIDVNTNLFQQSSLETSMTNLTARVKDFYSLMDKIYEDIRDNNNNPYP